MSRLDRAPDGCASSKHRWDRADDFEDRFNQPPHNVTGEPLTTDAPTVINICQNPIERTPSRRAFIKAWKQGCFERAGHAARDQGYLILGNQRRCSTSKIRHRCSSSNFKALVQGPGHPTCVFDGE